MFFFRLNGFEPFIHHQGLEFAYNHFIDEV